MGRFSPILGIIFSPIFRIIFSRRFCQLTFSPEALSDFREIQKFKTTDCRYFKHWSRPCFSQWKFLSRTFNESFRLLQEKLDERFPAERIDFTRLLPRNLSLHILSFLDPRSLSRCAQVSWYMKWLAESDQLWRPKCLRFGWYPPYKPRYYCYSNIEGATIRPRKWPSLRQIFFRFPKFP